METSVFCIGDMNIVGLGTMNVEIGYEYDEVIHFSVFMILFLYKMFYVYMRIYEAF